MCDALYEALTETNTVKASLLHCNFICLHIPSKRLQVTACVCPPQFVAFAVHTAKLRCGRLRRKKSYHKCVRTLRKVNSPRKVLKVNAFIILPTFRDVTAFSNMRKVVIGLCIGWSALGAAASDILQPEADYRDFRLYQLSNGMQALAVHHPRSTEAGFSVAAKTGSLYDPENIPGLAHFLEHMLFLGTSKYPDPESYDSFLTQNGGSNNAYTDEEKTVFFNKVADTAFEEALDRFAEFFKAPLFNRKYEEKEVNAIDAEHQKNIPNDDERAWYTIRSLAKGPMSRFATGNTATLSTIPKKSGIDVVENLHDFHTKYYCGSNMVSSLTNPVHITVLFLP